MRAAGTGIGSARSAQATQPAETPQPPPAEAAQPPPADAGEHHAGSTTPVSGWAQVRVRGKEFQALNLATESGGGNASAGGEAGGGNASAGQLWWTLGRDTGLGYGTPKALSQLDALYDSVVAELLGRGFLPPQAWPEQVVDGVRPTPSQHLASLDITGRDLNQPGQAFLNWRLLVEETLNPSMLTRWVDDLFGADQAQPGVTLRLTHPDGSSATLGLAARVPDEKAPARVPEEAASAPVPRTRKRVRFAATPEEVVTPTLAAASTPAPAEEVLARVPEEAEEVLARVPVEEVASVSGGRVRELLGTDSVMPVNTFIGLDEAGTRQVVRSNVDGSVDVALVGGEVGGEDGADATGQESTPKLWDWPIGFQGGRSWGRRTVTRTGEKTSSTVHTYARTEGDTNLFGLPVDITWMLFDGEVDPTHSTTVPARVEFYQPVSLSDAAL